MDIEMGMEYPGMWRSQRKPEHCCIYRVPDCIRRVNPEAYTPQLVIIGPLHHSLKSQALKSRGDIKDARSMGYLNMEAHKKFYLAEFAKRVDEEITIDGFRRIIEENEEIIRESYSESTSWIESPEFVDMILHDSVFTLEFMVRMFDYSLSQAKAGDPLVDEHCLMVTIWQDLILLENQLPYLILEKLFAPIFSRIFPNRRVETYHEFIIFFIAGTTLNRGSTGNNLKFTHFTDIVRGVLVETLPEYALDARNPIKHIYNADKLDNGGIKFKAVEEACSLHVRFENGCVTMSPLLVADRSEMMLRNVIALEQCHYSRKTYVSNYVLFLDYLIDTEKDVSLLVEKGIIINMIGQDHAVAEMVNKLCLGIIVDYPSYYSDIVDKVKAHYSNPVHRSHAILKRVYFGNLWTGTATVAATFLLVMTLIQTIASVMQVKQKDP